MLLLFELANLVFKPCREKTPASDLASRNFVRLDCRGPLAVTNLNMGMSAKLTAGKDM